MNLGNLTEYDDLDGCLALETVHRAFELCGILKPGETISEAEGQLGLNILNLRQPSAVWLARQIAKIYRIPDDQLPPLVVGEKIEVDNSQPENLEPAEK
jgi:hypothetical protein